ncbi:MAG: cyclic nucleotide-binding protein [Nocardioidaceae bacterium]|nr:cyclic nucleotide-binding protein [Nocardioidaceae bacterium]
MNAPDLPANQAAGQEGTRRPSRDLLRSLFLFESLDDDRLDWISEHALIESRPAGVVYSEGETATCLFVLLSGTVSLRRTVRGDEVELNRTDRRGAYAGATESFVGEGSANYPHSVYAITACEFVVIASEDFAYMVRTWFPMAVHLLDGLFVGMRANEAIVGQRERLLALGQLTAGLTHELNNPAAAAARATSSLRERVSSMRHQLAGLASGELDPEVLASLTTLQEDAVGRVAKAPSLSPLEASDREESIAEWLDDRDVPGAYDLSPVMVAAGLDRDFLERVATSVALTTGAKLEGALRWITCTVETEQLMNEIQDAVDRVSALVAAAKQYSQLDRGTYASTDVHAGLDSTLVMLAAKLGVGIRLVKDYDRTLPAVNANGAELNQVWTNLLDNAISAMGGVDGAGTLTVRTGRDDDFVVVEIGDTGPGVPDDIVGRIFEPFFSTKPVGAGTGLGLDISYRIVAQRHGGDLRVDSRPGDTRFQVRLPLEPPDSTAAAG